MSISALSIAVSALRTHSYAIETTSHNVANAATPGYRRQRVDLRAAFPRQGALGTMGSGVEATGISRASDRLADLRARSAQAQAGYFGTRAEIGTNAEDVFGEPDRGVSVALTGLWGAFAALAVAPSDEAARQQVLAALGDVASRVNQVRQGLDSLATDGLARLGSEVDLANEATARLAEINRHAPAGLPPDLADERDRLLDGLAESMGAVAQIQDDGRARVTLSGLALVDGEHATMLDVATAPGIAITHPAGPVTAGGTAGGLAKALTDDVPGLRAKLDTFVADLISDLNALHATGVTPTAIAGGALLADGGGVVTVVPTSTADLAAAGAAGGAQNGMIADALAQLRIPLGEAYRSVANAVSTSVASLQGAADTAQSVADANGAARDALVGVNLDEEMSQLITQQRAYEAAARVITTIDEMLQTLLAM